MFEKISFVNEGWEPWFANKLPKTANNEIKDKCDFELVQKLFQSIANCDLLHLNLMEHAAFWSVMDGT